MEEKERYEVISPSLNGYAYIHDFKTDNVLNTYDSCDLLNQQDKRINELCQENQQLKQQLHDLPKKIVEEIKDKIPEIGGMKCEIIIDDFLTLNTLLDTILKKYSANKNN